MQESLLTIRGSERLVCDADPFGARPMYVVEGVDETIVATSQQELRRVGAVCGLDPDRIRMHLLGNTLDPLVGGVQRVPPGAKLKIEGGKVTLRAGPGWEREDLSKKNRNQLRGELLDRLGDAADRQLGRHEPAICLGIGIDSAALLALLEDRRPSTWTLVSGPLDPDLLNTVKLAKHFNANHHMVEARESMLPDLFEAAVRASESLLWNARSVAFHHLHTTIAAEHDVVLSGVGADALLMGNPRMLRSTSTGPPPIARRFEDDRRLARRLLADGWEVPDPAPAPDLGLEEARDLQIRATLPHDVTPLGCRSPLSAGLEVLLPYMDPRMTSFALGLHPDDLVERGMGKTLLREAWDGIIPNPIRMRPKRQRLSPPGGGGADAHVAWLELFDGLLSEARLQDLQVVDPVKVRRLIGVYSKEERYDHPGFAVMDRVLMRLASLSVLSRALS